MPCESDVIIIGAGAAGLSAAKKLASLGISYTLLEGSHRIGGRAYSEEIAPDVWFDLGCSYLHQAETNAFVNIADQLGIVLGKEFGQMFEFANLKLFKNGNPLSEFERHQYQIFLDDCYRAFHTAMENKKDISVADLIDLDNEFAPIYMHAMAETNTLDIDETSAIDYISCGEGQDYPVLRGYGNLVADWAVDIDAELNTAVQKIEWNGNKVKVTTNRGALSSRVVLTTVSNGVLAANDIEFSPPLPDWKIEAVMGLPTGTENKICLHFNTDIFGAEGRGFYQNWNDAGDTGEFEASVMGQNTAIAFIGGRHAIWLEKQGSKASEAYALDLVAGVFGNDIRKHVNRTIATAWTTEPWTKGSYSCALPGQSHQRKAMAEPIDNWLFFAGEATTGTDHSCCHGAFESGKKAAIEISEILKRNPS